MFPRTLRCSTAVGFLPLSVSFTCFRCVFMLTSTPVDRARRRDFRARQSSLASLALRLVPLASRLPSSLLAASRSSPRFPRFAFALLSFVLARRPRASRAVVVIVHAPMIVPCAVVPFLSSIVTLSLESFCKNRTSFMASRRLRASSTRAARATFARRRRCASAFSSRARSRARASVRAAKRDDECGETRIQNPESRRRRPRPANRAERDARDGGEARDGENVRKYEKIHG